MKIAVRVCNWIGDVIMNLPALEALRGHYPDAEIVAVARPWVADILAFRADLVDRYITFEDKKPLMGPLAFWKFTRRLRAERFDMAVVFTKHLKGALMTWMAGIPVRVGMGSLETRWFLNRGISFGRLPKTGRHQSQNYLDLLAHAGVPVDYECQPRLQPDEDMSAAMAARYLPGRPRPWLVVHAGASYGTAKRWAPERFAQVCRDSIAAFGGTVVLLGVEVETEVNDQVAGLVDHPNLVNLCGRTSLRESLAMISRADVFLSNDSGLMHVAGAFQRPQVAVFGPTDVRSTFPNNHEAAVLHHQVTCSPCYLRHCPIGHDCMKGVGTTAVWSAVKDKLDVAVGVTDATPTPADPFAV